MAGAGNLTVTTPRMMLRVALLQGDKENHAAIADISASGGLSALLDKCRDKWGDGKLVRLKSAPAWLIESNTTIHAVYAWVQEQS